MVIHRNLKASKILVTATGIPQVVDFETAKLIQPDVGDEGHHGQREHRCLDPSSPLDPNIGIY